MLTFILVLAVLANLAVAAPLPQETETKREVSEVARSVPAAAESGLESREELANNPEESITIRSEWSSDIDAPKAAAAAAAAARRRRLARREAGIGTNMGSTTTIGCRVCACQ